MKSLLKVINEWKTRYPKAKILGHNEFPNSNKTCPNFDVQKWCKKRWLSKLYLPTKALFLELFQHFRRKLWCRHH